MDDSFLNIHNDGDISVVYGDIKIFEALSDSNAQNQYGDDDDDYYYYETHSRELISYNSEFKVDSINNNYLFYIRETNYHQYDSYWDELDLTYQFREDNHWTKHVPYTDFGYSFTEFINDFSFSAGPGGELHLVTSNYSQLHYIYKAQEHWESEMNVVSGGVFSSVDTDWLSNFFISHFSGTNENYSRLPVSIVMVIKSSGEWSKPRLIADNVLWNSYSVVKDSDDFLHVTHVNKKHELIYTFFDSNNCTSFILDSGLAHGKTSVAIDNDDTLHVSYFYEDEDQIQYAKFPRGNSELFESTAIFPFKLFYSINTSDYPNRAYIYSAPLDVDSNGHVHMTYRTCTTMTGRGFPGSCSQMYATNESGDWESLTLYTTREHEW